MWMASFGRTHTTVCFVKRASLLRQDLGARQKNVLQNLDQQVIHCFENILELEIMDLNSKVGPNLNY